MRITDFPELIAPTGNDLLVTVDIANDLTKKVKLDNLPISLPALTALATKQDSLVSGVTIKTVNSQSLLGAGDIPIPIVNPSGVAGAIQFSNGSAFASDAANFFWDNTNKRLGIGFNAPTARLQVRGSGSTSATTSLLVQNSTGSSILTFSDDGTLNSSQGSMYAANGSMYASRAFLTNIDSPFFNTLSFASGTTFPRFGQTSDAGVFLYKGVYNPTSGSGNFDVFYAQPTINQTGGANGITRGLYINPTLTAAADFRAIEVSNGGAYINTTSVQASAILQADSTTKGFLPPRMTTTQKNAIASPAAGLIVYDSTLGKLCVRTASAWETITSV
jgi:hypothetical protein